MVPPGGILDFCVPSSKQDSQVHLCLPKFHTRSVQHTSRSLHLLWVDLKTNWQLIRHNSWLVSNLLVVEVLVVCCLNMSGPDVF